MFECHGVFEIPIDQTRELSGISRATRFDFGVREKLHQLTVKYPDTRISGFGKKTHPMNSALTTSLRAAALLWPESPADDEREHQEDSLWRILKKKIKTY